MQHLPPHFSLLSLNQAIGMEFLMASEWSVSETLIRRDVKHFFALQTLGDCERNTCNFQVPQKFDKLFGSTTVRSSIWGEQQVCVRYKACGKEINTAVVNLLSARIESSHRRMCNRLFDSCCASIESYPARDLFLHSHRFLSLLTSPPTMMTFKCFVRPQ